MVQEYQTLHEMVQKVQGDKTLTWLRDNAPHVQLELIKECIRTALKLSLPAAAEAEQAMRLISMKAINDPKYAVDDKKPDKQLARAFNDFAREHSIDLRIIANGYKGLDRLLKKQLQKGQEMNEVSDLIRVTICSKQSPDIVEQFRDEMKKSHDHFDDKVGVKPSGMMSSDFRIAFKGIVSQIEVAEKDLMIRGGRISHGLYEINREISGVAKDVQALDFQQNTISISRRYLGWKAITDDMLHEDYDVRLTKFTNLKDYIHKTAPMLEDRECDRMVDCFDNEHSRLSYLARFLRLAHNKHLFNGMAAISDNAELRDGSTTNKVISNSLLQLSQLVHVAYIHNAEAPWREKYVHEVSAMNKAAGREIMPQALLDLVGTSPHISSGRGRE